MWSSLWHSMAWSKEWSQLDIMAKELLPIVLACAVWRPLLSGCRAEFKGDNQSPSFKEASIEMPLVLLNTF